MNYSSYIQSSPVVLIEFYATWCPHCHRMAPVVEQIKELLDGQVPVVQLDIDAHQAAAEEAGVESVPTFIIYRDGSEVWRHSGEIDGNDLYSQIQSYL